MATATLQDPAVGRPEAILGALQAARAATLGLAGSLSRSDLEAVHSPLMSPLVWDLGHIAAYEDLWLVHRQSGADLLRPDMAELYDAFETPRAVRGDIRLLDCGEAHGYLEQVRARARAVLADRGAGDTLVHEMVIQHEHQHHETMLQTLGLARLPGHRPPGLRDGPQSGSGHSGLEYVDVPAGPFWLGAPAGRFSYDNERPRQRVELAAFRLGRTPVTNATWLRFAEGGGYERREWWSDEGWAWKEEYDISRPGGWVTDPPRGCAPNPPAGGEEARLGGRPVFEWRVGGWEPLHPERPVVHVSWFEADAFARAHGARLPTETEWEKAATWDQHKDRTRSWPWGEEPLTNAHANLLDYGLFGTAPVGAHPGGASPCGALGLLGDVWEWTASAFDGYRGFWAHPYREYSQVFFGSAHRVLRGGSWATAARVATPTMRNWDLPQRRQIFAGVRLAQSA